MYQICIHILHALIIFFGNPTVKPMNPGRFVPVLITFVVTVHPLEAGTPSSLWLWLVMWSIWPARMKK